MMDEAVNYTGASKHGGLSLEETARAMGISKELVRVIEKNALAKMRKALEAYGIRGVADVVFRP